MRLPTEPWWKTFWRWLDDCKQEETQRRMTQEHTQLARDIRQVVWRREQHQLSRLRLGALLALIQLRPT